MQALLDVILPVFLVLGAGYAAARGRLFTEAGIDGLMRFGQNIAVPCLLFRGVARLDLATAYDPGLMAAFYLGVLAAFGAGIAGGRWLFGRSVPDALAMGFAGAFSNSLLLGLPITERAYGAGALAGNIALISVHAPVLYVLGITSMEVVRSRGAGLSVAGLGVQVGRALLVQPLVLGIIAGMAVNLSGLPLPDVVWSATGMLATAGIPAALFGLGGVLHRYRPAGDMRAILMVVAISLLLHPGVTWALGIWFGLTVDQMRSAVVTAAMAPGVNAYLYAHMYGAAQRVSASAVLIGTGACIITAWGWLSVLP